MKRCTLAFFLLWLSCSALLAEQLPSRTRGLSADSIYQVGDLDDINLFNGNLTLTIPIGQVYPVSPQLSYRLSLIYNSNVWEYEDQLSCVDIGGKVRYYNYPYVTPSSNAGAGWSLHLGRLYAPQDAVFNKHNPNWLYVSPDGGQHNFYERLHPTEPIVPNVFYSVDGSYLRLDLRTPSAPVIEAPSGTRYHFSPETLGGYHLARMEDRFENWVEVDYGPTSWTITDSHGREHVLTVNGEKQVTKVELEAFAGSTATYHLSYVAASLRRHRFNQESCDPLPERQNAQLLSGLSLPDTGSYAFTYDTDDSTSTSFSGALRKAVLPAGGRIEWDYSTYAFQSQAPTFPESSTTQQRGVGARRTYLVPSGGPVHGSWTYVYTLGSHITVPGGPFMVSCFHRMRVSDNLSQNVTDSYFATAGGSDFWWYGLPYAPCNPDTGTTTLTAWSAANSNPYLSTRVHRKESNGSLTPIRSTYVIYDSDGRDAGDRQDRNHRLRYQKIVYHDDLDGSNSHFEETINSDFDGFGNYRRVSRKSSFGVEKIMAAEFLPAGTYQLNPDNSSPIDVTGFSMPAIGDPWIFGLSSGSATTQGTLVSKRETCYDLTTGFLERQRILAGTDQHLKDVIVEYQEGTDGDGHGGFSVAERTYGGDVSANADLGSLCSLSLDSPSFVKHLRHQYGSVSRSAWVEPCAENQDVLVTDEATIDQSTGLASTITEPNGLEVALDYDAMGRLLSEVPQEGASRVHRYLLSPLSYEVRHCPQGTSNFCLTADRLSDRYWSYDALGRMANKSLAYPTPTGHAEPSMAYEIDGIGRKTKESTWGETQHTLYSEFDVFSRARRIAPDGISATLLTFRGERIKGREVKVATGIDTTSSVFATEVHDHHGRLVAVCDGSSAIWSGTGPCPGQLTRYGYDQDDRLAKVCQNESGGVCGQERLFVWDGRGFLISETHPEIGASGRGKIVYQRDAQGNPTSRNVDLDGGDRPLRTLYDRAGRPVKVEEQAAVAGWRVLKEFFYARKNPPSGGEMPRSQLVMARRTNWLTGLAPLPNLIEGNIPLVVTDHYQYFGLAGGVSKKTTSISLPTGGQSFTSQYTYTPLGAVASIQYPRGDWPYQATPSRTVDFNYRLGFLTGIPNYASAVTYQLGGMLHEIQYTNGNRWRQTPEAATGWERPGRIETLNSAMAVIWSTGDYAYDGAGNISAIGERDYVYDAFSRFSYVSKAGITPNEQQATYDAYGNVTSLATSGATRTLTTDVLTNRLSVPNTVYTSNGELEEVWIDGAHFKYAYDGLGQQLFQQAVGKTWLYVYDANDERVMSWECALDLCGAGTNFERYTLRGLGGEVLRVFEGKSRATVSWKEDFVHRNGQQLAWVKPGAGGTEQRFFLHPDHLGSTRQVTNSAGAQVARHDFLPFGEESTTTTSGDVPLKFTGHERDQIGRPHDYMHARFYSPNLGRFLKVDPLAQSAVATRPQTWNRYSYVENNPLRMVDLDGGLPVPVELVWSRAKHVWRRHVKKDEFLEKTKFKSNNLEDAKKLAERTVNGADTVKVQPDGRYVYERGFSKDPGQNGENGMRVVTEKLGGNQEKVITAYPIQILAEYLPGIATILFGKEVVIGAATAAAERLEREIEAGVAAERNRKQREIIDMIEDN